MSFDIVMGKRYIAISYLMLLFLAACGENGDKSVSPDDEPVSVENSSSSEKLSSSSVILSASKESSSSLAKSSSSSIPKNSSSSEKAKSSSSKDEKETKESSSSVKSSSSSSVILSVGEESSSSSAKFSSSSKTIKRSSSSSDGVVWKLPKEAYLNPEIEYDSIVDERDGQIYKTVKIGEQTWMAENLNFNPGQGGSGENKYNWSWCYNNEEKNCDVAGRFYTWAAAIDSVKLANDVDNPQDCGSHKTCALPVKVQGICPTGWHLPDTTEWKNLFAAVGGQSSAGKNLKSQGGWRSRGNGTDAFGFSALPAGDRYAYGGSFRNRGDNAYFWSSTEDLSYSVYYVYLHYDNKGVDMRTNFKQSEFCIRCVKD